MPIANYYIADLPMAFHWEPMAPKKLLEQYAESVQERLDNNRFCHYHVEPGRPCLQDMLQLEQQWIRLWSPHDIRYARRLCRLANPANPECWPASGVSQVTVCRYHFWLVQTKRIREAIAAYWLRGPSLWNELCCMSHGSIFFHQCWLQAYRIQS